uniref:Methionine aminopeptidase n=1 Tax=Dermatophagoides pteronyssinus TaxID=6956 RepID=A0A6P6YCD2_DERPT|nr:methionine aminopeptidase 1D, mitochondrial-like [Dermatophagoides pteronyssinus]
MLSICKNNFIIFRNLLQKFNHYNNLVKQKFFSTTNFLSYEIIEPKYPISSITRNFPRDILLPDYAINGQPNKHNNSNYVKNPNDIEKIWNSCKIAKTILMKTGEQLKIGMTCEDIDDIVYNLCLLHKCYPSPLNYSGFPKCVTTSVNNIAVHGIPDQRQLQSGDIISIDVSIYYNGFHGDCCHTFAIGDCDQQAKHLMNVAELCLYEAIKICRSGQRISAIGKTIENIVRKYEMNVVKEFCGHGVGKDLHENPQILHYDNNSEEIMIENMIFTIEPIILETSANVVMFDDGWTVASENDCRSAQFEHTIWIRKHDSVILTEI